MRTLLCLFEYRAHVENLPSEEIHEVMAFCIKLARDLNVFSDDCDAQSSVNTPLSFNGRSMNTTRLSRSATPSAIGKSGTSFNLDNSQRMRYPQLQSSAAGIVSCLQHLVCVPLDTVMENAGSIFAVLFDLLQSHPGVSTVQQPAFEAINSLFPHVLTSNIELACDTLTRFIPLVRSFWQIRSAGLKEVLLSILIHGESLFQLLIPKDESNECKANLSVVLEVLRQEYLERRQNERLLIEDVDLSDYTLLPHSQPPLRCGVACVRRGAMKAEESWSILQISAAIVVTLDDSPLLREVNEQNDLNHQDSKRQRLTKPLDDILVCIRDTRMETQIYGLQVLAFVFEKLEFDEQELSKILDSVSADLSDENGTIASWAMFTTAWWVYTIQKYTVVLIKSQT